MGDGVQGQAFPELEVDDGPLVFRELAEGGVEGLTEGGFVRVVGGLEEAGDLVPALGPFVGAGPGVATAGQVDELVPGDLKEESPWIPGGVQQAGVFDEPTPEVLEQVAGVGFGPGQLEQEREHGVAVFLEDLFKRFHAGSEVGRGTGENLSTG